MRLALLGAAAAVVAAACAWNWLRPIAPVDTPYFRWQPTADDRYELAVSHVGGNPAFRRGVTTTPVPHSGTLRVVGPSGAAEPGAEESAQEPVAAEPAVDRGEIAQVGLQLRGDGLGPVHEFGFEGIE